jgi:hypothetical protein
LLGPVRKPVCTLNFLHGFLVSLGSHLDILSLGVELTGHSEDLNKARDEFF